jgi:cold shock CspA family protein
LEIGLIEWFDKDKGFGVLITPDNIEVFLHISNWKHHEEITSNNRTPIIFKKGNQRGKTTALDCRYFNFMNKNDWDLILSLKQYSYCIRVNFSQINLLKLTLSKSNVGIDCTIITNFFTHAIEQTANESLQKSNEFVFEIYKVVKNVKLKNKLLKIITFRINELNDDEILSFWKNNIVPEYLPNKSFIIEYIDSITANELKRIDEADIKHLIITNKLNKLSENFVPEDFVAFQRIFELIESETFQKEISIGLNRLADNDYANYVSEKIFELATDNDSTAYTFEQFIHKQPRFLSKSYLDNLKSALKIHILNNCSFRIIAECLDRDVLDKIDDSLLLRIKTQNNADLIYFLKSKYCDTLFTQSILDNFFSNKDFITLLNQAKNISDEIFIKYENLIFETVTDEEYFDLWKNNKGKSAPLEFLSSYLNHQEERYIELEGWFIQKKLSQEETTELLFKNVNNSNEINTRYEFYRVYYSIYYLLKNNFIDLDKIIAINNDFINLILWHFKKIEAFDFETLKGKFIYFKPYDQVYIFKRLFYLKNKGQIEFDLIRLDEIVRADIDLHLTNEKINGDFVLDISTHIIIECMKSFVETNNFIFKSDLILKDIRQTKKQRFEIEKYFDFCEGRLSPDWKQFYDLQSGSSIDYNWRSSGLISQVFYNGDSFYYSIEFVPGVEIEEENYYGQSHTYFRKNDNFDNLVSQVELLPGGKWNPKENHWGIPAKYKDQVFEFAKMNGFYINLSDKKHYENNKHLLSFSRQYIIGRERDKIIWQKNIPNGITYCEGRKANKEHKTIGKDFWWCANQECFKNCVTEHHSQEYENNILAKRKRNSDLVTSFFSNILATNEEKEEKARIDKEIWEEYTLLDFLKILKINVDEDNGFDKIENGHYFKFLGHINAFNRLLARLYCKECDSMLYPKNSSHFALYTDVRFYCIEETCSKQHQEVYLNHCLYGECKTIIDSRVSKRCKHGLYVCKNCGTCCSEEFFNRRLKNLKKVGGYIHPELIFNVENKNGHLEKKEYYCYKCASMMTEEDSSSYRCTDCNVHYNLKKFKWLKKKWTETHRRRIDYPTDE